MDVLQRLGAQYEELAAVCRKHHLTGLAFFGSVLTDAFGSDSDVDILIDYDRNHIPGWNALYEIQQDFERLFRRHVHFTTFGGLTPAWQEVILPTIQDIYAA